MQSNLIRSATQLSTHTYLQRAFNEETWKVNVKEGRGLLIDLEMIQVPNCLGPDIQSSY